MEPGDRPDADAANTRRDVLTGLRNGVIIGAVALAVLYPFFGSKFWHRAAPQTPLASASAGASAPRSAVVAQRATLPVTSVTSVWQPLERRLDMGNVRAPNDVTQVAAWAVREADNGLMPFAIVDKRQAQVYVFENTGKLLGTSPVLLGYAAGDDTVAGIGNKTIEEIKPEERTTPAGRFVSAPGKNSLGHGVVWVDYDAAVSMHRVRATNPKERRLERLATATPADNRISWGCINVPVPFFEQTVWPQFGHGKAVVYVLPEKKPLMAFFPAAVPQNLAQAVPARSNSAKP